METSAKEIKLEMTDLFKDNGRMFAIHHRASYSALPPLNTSTRALNKTQRKVKKNKKKLNWSLAWDRFSATSRLNQQRDSSAGKTSISAGHMCRVGFVHVHQYSRGEEGGE